MSGNRNQMSPTSSYVNMSYNECLKVIMNVNHSYIIKTVYCCLSQEYMVKR